LKQLVTGLLSPTATVGTRRVLCACRFNSLDRLSKCGLGITVLAVELLQNRNTVRIADLGQESPISAR
jgi:hypothetical protein